MITRFLAGGLLVSLFAVLGDLIKPKSLAGICGAAPSVALATLGLTIGKDGPAVAGIEGRSMLAGAVALGVFTLLVMRLLMRSNLHAWQAVLTSMAVWFGTAFGLWFVFLR